MRKRILAFAMTVLVLFTFIFPLNAFAEEEPSEEESRYVLTGTVLDEAAAPVNGAFVKATYDEQEFSAVSGEDGAFTMSELPAGEMKLTVTAGDDLAPYTASVQMVGDKDLGVIRLSFIRYAVHIITRYASASWTVTGTEPGSGTVSGSDTLTVRRGDTLQLVPAPMDGCEFAAVTVNGAPADLEDGALTLPVNEKLEIEVVTNDVTAPVIESVNVEKEHDWAQTKTATVTASDNSGEAVRVYLSRNAYDTASGVKEFAELLPDGAALLTENGLWYVYAMDQSSNFSVRELQIEKIDAEPPVVSALTPSTTGGTHAVTYTFTASDNGELASVAVTLPDGEQENLPLTADGAYSFELLENGTVVVTVTDKAGNISTVDATAENIDWSAPAVTVVPQEAWDAEQNKAQIAVVDASAITMLEILDENDAVYVPDPAEGENSYSFTAYANGEYRVRAVDEAGNETVQPFEISRIDTEAPIIAHVEKDPETEWTAQAITVTVAAEDGQSGVKTLYYRLSDSDEETWTAVQPEEGTDSFTITVPNDRDMVEPLFLYVEDGVGRISEQSELAVAIDVSAPEQVFLTMDKTEDGGFFKELADLLTLGLLYRDKVSFEITASDLGSGAVRAEYQFAADGEAPEDDAWTELEPEEPGEEEDEPQYRASVSVEMDDFSGYLYVRVYDLCGNAVMVSTNVEDGESTVIILENTPENDDERAEAPTLNAVTGNGAAYSEGVWTNQNVTVKAEAEGPVSGVAYYEYQIVPHGSAVLESAWQLAENASVTITGDSNADVYFRAVSNAENATRSSHMTVRVQKTPPRNADVSVSGKQGTGAWYIQYPAIQITEPVPEANHAPITTWYKLRLQGADAAPAVFGASRPEIRADGIYELTVWTTDAAGNQSAPLTKTLYVDTTAPKNLSLRVDDTSILAEDQSGVVFRHIYNRTVRVVASADCDVSGLAAMSYQKVYDMSRYSYGGNWTPWPSNGLQIAPNENCVVFLKVVDKAGNVSVVHSDGMIMDNTAPSGKDAPELSVTPVGANGSGYFAGDAKLRIDVRDPEINNSYSGLRTISYEVVTDGTVTQGETVAVGESGELLRQTDLTRGNHNAVSAWSGLLTVKASANNSDNIVIRVTATDRAGNARTSETKPGLVKIDVTPPAAEISYDNNTALLDGGKYYFNADRTITVTVTDRTVGDNELKVTRNGKPVPVSLTWKKVSGALANGDDNRFTASFRFAEDGEYEVSFAMKDLAGNALKAPTYDRAVIAPTRFILDKTEPVLELRYDNNKVFNGSYFDAPRTATIKVVDANFDPAALVLNISAKDGSGNIPAPALGAWTHDGDTHTAAVKFEQDGVYGLTVRCTDRAGNASSGVTYPGAAAPTSFTVDTKPVQVTVDSLENFAAYNGPLAPVVRYSDANMDGYSLTLTVTNMERSDVDVTKRFVKGEENGEIRLEFPEDENVDGIYLLTWRFGDKAGHLTEDTMKFTVNRNGSVFEYSKDLLELLNRHVVRADGVYTITEYNPSEVTGRALTVTVDGTPFAEPAWESETLRECGNKWYMYEYTVDAKNFENDGQYRVILASEDGAHNRTEATPDILFWVDTTPPELTLVRGMEHSVVNAKEQPVTLDVYDTIGLESLTVTVTDSDGVTKRHEWIPDEEGHTSYSFTIPVKEGLRQHVRVVVTDLAGNYLDTDAEGYVPAFEFVDEITVSENFFLRWYADPWRFYGSLTGIAMIGASSVLLLVLLKKRKRKAN